MQALKENEVQGDYIQKTVFYQLCQSLQSEDVAKTFRTSKQHDRNAEKIEGAMGAQ